MKQQEVAMLILQRSEGGGQRWPLDRDLIRIGRSPDCEIILPERVVSREHAFIIRRADGYYLYDKNSKNGTYVNGEPVVDGHLLQDGDEIQIALRFRLAFVDAGATAPLTIDLPAGSETVGLHLDDTRRTVAIHGQELDPPLSVAQYRLLKTLVRAKGAVVSRQEVVRVVWPDADSEGVTEQAIDALVRRLRERLAELDPHHQYIITVRGHGFRFENPPARPSHS
ncbi:MAG: FHA domain-containing protein [Caldilineae bacterium]|nr:MAG: FHA domain-containing protein [Caldilineae bacterium]